MVQLPETEAGMAVQWMTMQITEPDLALRKNCKPRPGDTKFYEDRSMLSIAICQIPSSD